MTDEYQHLRIRKEALQNPRRTRNPPLFIRREDTRSHGQRLNAYFGSAQQAITKQIPSSLGYHVLKLHYEGAMSFENLIHHGVEFISQEGSQLCVVFASEQGLTIFADHLQRLGIDDNNITYKQLLEALNGIDSWTPEDRKSWAVQNLGFPDGDVFKVDVELWPAHVEHHPERIRLCEGFEKWLEDQEIQRIDRVNLDSLLMYRVEVTSAQSELLLQHSDVRMIDLTPKSGISYNQLNVDINEVPDNIPSPPEHAAKICILDSGIATNHPLLAPAIAESASFVDGEDEFDQNGHGTAVAGIALYGDIELSNRLNHWQPHAWIYNARVLDSNAEFDETTIEKTITKAVEHFTELGCRIFNVSLGNKNAPYDNKHIRGIAYVLDNLARKYDVLFVISTGNFDGNETPPVPRQSWRDEYPEYLLSEHSVLIDPAPALNALTVGSVASHNATMDQQQYADISQLSPASENQPSPFTRHGPSVKGALKPDLVAKGGNLANPIRQDNIQWQSHMHGLGVMTMNNNFVGGTLLTEISGTSFSAPYICHLAARTLNEYPDISTSTLRAMLINHAALPSEVKTTFPDAMKQQYKDSPDTKNRDICRDVAGYGMVDESNLYRSTENEVVLIAEERIGNNSHQFFELPLTEDFLRTQRATREVKVSLAYTPAVRTTRIDYVATRIHYLLIKGSSLEEVQAHFNQLTQNENETRNDDAVPNREISASLRKKGTVQSSTWTFRSRRPTEKWFVVVTRQDQPWGEALSAELEPYSLIVTVTDRENEEARLYTQIQERIQEQERVRAI